MGDEEKKEAEKPAAAETAAAAPEAKPAAKPEAKAEAKPEKQEKAAQAETAARKKKIRKINKMTLPEVEKQLSAATEKMGGSFSKYVQHLSARKEELLRRK